MIIDNYGSAGGVDTYAHTDGACVCYCVDDCDQCDVDSDYDDYYVDNANVDADDYAEYYTDDAAQY